VTPSESDDGAAVEILHLEDSDLDADFVRRRLEAGGLHFTLHRVADRRSFIEQLEGQRFDIVLSDFHVPEFDGFSALELTKQHQPETPFVFVSGAMGDEMAVETLKNGATDYVLKDRLGRLCAAVERALSESRERRRRRKAEERATSVLESLSDGFVVLDRDWRFTYVNSAFRAILGQSRTELVGALLEEVAPQPVVRMLKDRLGRVFENRKPVELNEPIELWERYLSVKASAADGGICIQFRDVTDVRRSSKALRVAEERFEFVRKSSGVGFWYCDLPFDVLEWDETVKEHFQLPPGANVTIDTFYERLHPDDRERTRQAIETSIAQRQPYRIDYRTVSPDGETVKWIRAIGRSAYDQQGQPVQFDGITLDVTDRIAVEEQVRDQAVELEVINHVGRTLAAELDLQKLVQTVTDATTELSGAEFGAFFYNVTDDQGELYNLFSLSGVPREKFEKFPMPRATELFGPTFRGEGILRLDDVTQDPRYGRNAPHHGMPKGHLPVRSYLAAPVISRSGQVLGGLFFGHQDPGVFTERSERIIAGVAAQAAVAIDNAHLFDAVRRANLEKDRLLVRERAARTELERAGRMKDEFLATLSHELRTPLNAILGWAQVMQLSSDSVPEDLREGIAIIERNARAQTRIIDDLLDMNRIISGKVRLDVQPVVLAPVVRAAIETVEPAAKAKEIRLQAVVDPSSGPISGDPNRLQQVFWNLLINAVKFTPKGGRIQVVLERVNSHVEFHVIDSGEGIDPAFLPHVFERFIQADSSTTRRHGGLGLGLAIVKQLVDLHGGSVSARSPGRGQGATFTVALPLTAIHPEPEAVVEKRHPSAGSSGRPPEPCTDLSGRRILVVDDEPDARSLLKRVLEDCEAEVIVAASAAEALTHLQKMRPDVIVSDIGMPDEDGFALIRMIRALPSGCGGATPAIALTAYARAEDRVNALVSGFQHHLAKPVEPAELIAVIASLVGKIPADDRTQK
jgi:PAS domain S-box-containing protein